jgi:hypothetical protein
VKDADSNTYEYLLASYGPLLTLQNLADVMHASPNGLRVAIARQRHPFSIALAGARRRMGRRVYFEARRVASAIDAGEQGSEIATTGLRAANAGG